MAPSIASFLARRQFRPTLWPTLAVVVLVAATVSLGNWQRHRAEEKEALRMQFDAAEREPPIQLSATASAATTSRYHLVRASGEYAARAQVLIDNKVHDGQAGYHVVTPLKLDGGGYVLVDRGWVRGGPRRSELPLVPPPAGGVTVEGRLNLPPARYLELRAGDTTGPVWQNLDIARIAAASGLPLLPYIVEQTSAASDGLVRDWPAPDFGSEQHRSYMVQWYAFALLGCVLWIALNWRVREPRND